MILYWWVEGSYKHDFVNEVTVDPPTTYYLRRRYTQKLPHQYAQMKSTFENIGGISDHAKELLGKYPHPQGHEYYDPT